MKPLLLVCALALAPAVWSQDKASGTPSDVEISQDTGLVTIAAKGRDVREVLFDLFNQSKKSFVLDQNVRTSLYLALSGVPFDEALEIVCHAANLKFEVNNGVYFLTRIAPPVSVTPEKTVQASPKPLGRLDEKDLQKRVTTKLSKADIRDVFAEFGKQAGITIEVDPKVPAYKVDAFLIGTSFKYAMDVVTKAAGLTYVRTENRTIKVETKPKG
ncbi:MAG: hypothetical protein JST30_04945 [Armatimonadetes bacterium]|nr:hypothetical protein [Armatimonadota bacterium]